jgi:hypothetical protein
MVKITKIEKTPLKRGKLRVDEQTEVIIERDELEARAIYSNEVVSRVGGHFEEWCFSVKEYKICIRKDELEGMLSVG